MTEYGGIDISGEVWMLLKGKWGRLLDGRRGKAVLVEKLGKLTTLRVLIAKKAERSKIKRGR